MADPRKRLKTNVAGDFFVDSTCINCDTCRQLAPTVYGEIDDHSCVQRQPTNDSEVREAVRALLACPTGSIGTTGTNSAKEVTSDFPLLLADTVYYSGFNSPKSYGGNSYFIKHPDGNWLVDSPKFLPQLKDAFARLGGIANIFLTHRDDVADAAQYAAAFGSRRIIHETELSAQPDSELVLRGFDDSVLGDDFLVIPTPGHTAGHCVLLYKNKYLFTGDHLTWDRDSESLSCYPDYCWYSWEEQKESITKLTNYQFEWVLPGHGQRMNLNRDEMHRHMEALSDRLSHPDS